MGETPMPHDDPMQVVTGHWDRGRRPGSTKHKWHSDIDNYRAITISPVLSKICENCLLSRFNRYFETSDLQCGFKAKAGCSEALSLLCSTVQYFTNNGSTVSIASLDMWKAFDKVIHYALFLKLMERQVPVCLINLLANWYENVFISVRWGQSL